MALTDRIKEDLKASMKAGEKTRTSVLRMLTAALKNERIQLKKDLGDEDVITVVGREMKKRREAALMFSKSGADDRAEAEEAEAAALAGYMPEPVGEAELEAAIDEVIASSGATTKKDMGRVMGPVMAKFKGRVDGGVVQKKVLGKLG
ncbi:MAG: GatB/YqeY domain-containing protein [Planctomycetota bacterium]